MRISDWSSDVCSSDLDGKRCRAATRRAGLSRLAALAIENRRGRERCTRSVRAVRALRGDAVHAVDQVWKVLDLAELREDRKSVGEGKVVSVSVDLGGRRIIKKTKMKISRCSRY